jgi:hypothetical protein
VGLFGRKRRPDDAVEDEAKVLAMGPTPKGARQTGKLDVEYRFTLAVQGREVEHTTVVPHDRMPLLGGTVPVLVSRTEPERLTIVFDRIPSLAERSRASAAAAQEGDSAGAAQALGFELRDPPGA